MASHESLISAFESFKLPNGTPDRTRRKAELTALLGNLEPWELSHVRALFKEKLRFADLPNLPDEVIGSVTQYLDQYDIAACTQVCKSWSAAFKRDGVVRYLINQSLSGLLQAYAGTDLESKRESADFYRQMMKQRSLRHQGRFHATLSVETGLREIDQSSFSPDSSNGPYPPEDWDSRDLGLIVGNERPRRTLYNCGRVAWELTDSELIIDDLVTNKRRLVSRPSKGEAPERFALQFLSEAFVILSEVADPKTIAIYHIETREWRKISFPGVPSFFFSKGTRICAAVGEIRQLDEDSKPGWPAYDPVSDEFVIMLETIYVWDWTDGSRAPMPLETVPPKMKKLIVSGYDIDLSKLGVIFHPTKPEILFLICFQMGTKPDGQTNADDNDTDEEDIETDQDGSQILLGITATKYVDGKLTKIFEQEYALDPTPEGAEDPFLHLYFTAANGNGKYSLAGFHHPVKARNGDMWEFEVRGSVVYFDTVTERFSLTKYPGGSQRTTKDLWYDWNMHHYTAKPFIWDGLVYYRIGQSPEGTITGSVVRFADMEAEETRLKRPGAIQYLPLPQQFLEDDDDPGTLWGDERFLVFTTGGGYVVWTFDETVDSSAKGWRAFHDKKRYIKAKQSAMEGHFNWLKSRDTVRDHDQNGRYES